MLYVPGDYTAVQLSACMRAFDGAKLLALSILKHTVNTHRNLADDSECALRPT